MLLFCSQNIVFAASESVSNNNEFFVNSMNGSAFLYNNNFDLGSKTDQNVNVEKLDITYVGDKFKISGILNYESETVPFETLGNFYPVEGGGYYDDKLILGDFQVSGSYNFPQIRIESNCSSSSLLTCNSQLKNQNVISLMIEDTSNGNLYYIQGVLSNDVYNSLLGLSKNLITNMESSNILNKDQINEKTMSLMNYGCRFIKRQKINDSLNTYNFNFSGKESASYNTTSLTQTPISESNKTASVSYSELSNFLSDMETYKTESPSYYSSDICSLMQSTGWNFYYQLNQNPRFYYALYGEQNGWKYDIQISMFDVVFNTSNQKYPSVQSQLKYGAVLEYDTYSNQYKLVYLNAGIWQSNLKEEIYGPTGNNIFYSRTLYGSLESPPSLFNNVISLIPYASNIYDAWQNLTTYQNSPLGQKFTWDDTIAEQEQRWNGDVVRGIVGDFSGAMIKKEGEYALIEGDTSLSCSSFQFAISYTGNSTI
ncbi:MAG: hypothetical protein P4L45_15910 [Ignavibacteriaceae bacterium]|nr:hypothetical protein [Ignavibacteriaceae bacterium]